MEHSERNHSKTEPMRFIQMWIMPARLDLPPSVEQRSFNEAERRGRIRPLIVPAPGFGSAGAPQVADAVTVHQDAVVYGGLLGAGGHGHVRLRHGFGGYAFIVHGMAELSADGADAGRLEEGGAAKMRGVERVEFDAGPDGAEILLVETRLR
jgi:hypothetical protein